MKILYSWLKDYVSVKDSPDKLAERLSFSSFETVVLQRTPRGALLDVSLKPNRVADCASHFGIAREIGLLTQSKVQFRQTPFKESSRQAKNSFAVDIRSKDAVRRYSARMIDGITVKASPQWLQKRLTSCGLRPINNVVDATNYVMLELGQPLHAFDADEIKKHKIIVRQGRKGEKIETIERKTYTLQGSEILIADEAESLGFAGIKGGRRGEITQKTKTIIIESANFDPTTTRATSRLHNLKTDASWRFENDLDPNMTIPALDRAAGLIQEFAGGEILKGAVDFYPKKVLPRPIMIDVARISRLIGEKVRETAVVNFVKPFCDEVKRLGKGKLLLKVKTYRRDLCYPEDIVEEVARLIGYNAIAAKTPFAPLTPPKRNEALVFRDIVRNHLISLGFSETYTYSFISEEDVKKFAFAPRELIEIENPISETSRFLRRGLLPNLLKNVRDNFRFNHELHLFEIGKQYRWKGTQPEERLQLGGIVSRKRENPKELFFEAKGALEALFERLGLDRDDYDFEESSRDRHLIPGATALLLIDREEVGKFGLIRREFTRAYDIDEPIAYFRIDIGMLERSVEGKHEFEPLQKYPDVIRDISFLVPQAKRIDDIEEAIYAASPRYLEEVELFDIYEGEGISDSRKSLAFHLIFRASNRTLTSAEVDNEIAKIRKTLDNLGAQIR